MGNSAAAKADVRDEKPGASAAHPDSPGKGSPLRAGMLTGIGREKRDVYVQNVFSTVAPHIDLLSFSFSLGLSNLWRRAAVARADMKKGQRVLDACTGTGQMAFLLAGKVGREGQVVAVDFCEDMLVLAREKLRKTNHGRGANIAFVSADAKCLDYPDDSFDAVTVSFGMRNIPDTVAGLRELRRVLRPGCRFVCLELTRPPESFFLSLYRWYVYNVMPFASRVVTKTDMPYRYLSRSIYGFYTSEEFRRIIEECGFADVKATPLTLGVASLYIATKKEKTDGQSPPVCRKPP